MLTDGRVNKPESGTPFGDLRRISEPFFPELPLLIRNNDVLVLIGKEVAPHGLSGLSKELVSQALREEERAIGIDGAFINDTPVAQLSAFLSIQKFNPSILLR